MRMGITGHRGLPGHVERLVRTALVDLVEQQDPGSLVGVTCVADGPDTWFAEAVLDHGGAIEVVVPAEEYRESLPESHRATYDALLRRASDVHSTGLRASDSHAHQAGSEIVVRSVDLLVAVWDGKPARGYGGTADAVAFAARTGVPYAVLWPDGAVRD